MQGHQIVQVKRKDQFDLKSLFRDFPGDPVIKNLPGNAGDKGLTPDQGTKIPHATWQGQKVKK